MLERITERDLHLATFSYGQESRELQKSEVGSQKSKSLVNWALLAANPTNILLMEFSSCSTPTFSRRFSYYLVKAAYDSGENYCFFDGPNRLWFDGDLRLFDSLKFSGNLRFLRRLNWLCN